MKALVEAGFNAFSFKTFGAGGSPGQGRSGFKAMQGVRAARVIALVVALATARVIALVVALVTTLVRAAPLAVLFPAGSAG